MISNLKSCATDGNFNMQIIHEYYIPITADIFRNCPKIQLWGGRAPASLILYKKMQNKDNNSCYFDRQRGEWNEQYLLQNKSDTKQNQWK